MFRRVVFSVAAFAVVMLTLTTAQQRRPAVQSVRLYVFENGSIRGLDPKLFNFTREELKEVDFTNTSYLIVHPKGTLMFDSGAVEDSHFKGNGAPVTEGIMSASKPLLPQLCKTVRTTLSRLHIFDRCSSMRLLTGYCHA